MNVFSRCRVTHCCQGKAHHPKLQLLIFSRRLSILGTNVQFTVERQQFPGSPIPGNVLVKGNPTLRNDFFSSYVPEGIVVNKIAVQGEKLILYVPDINGLVHF